MKTHILINYNEVTLKHWKNALGEDCITFEDGDLSIKVLDVPEGFVSDVTSPEERD